ncbi:MAG: efflux transporter, family, subunit [Massilibacillus sp.]|jgi:multidrug efflux pump subunit AcrA (membrane-fusion protein)|nr:efflux transporter, family, subunit [Massilibacillus sp.]
MRHDFSTINKKKIITVGVACIAAIGIIYFLFHGSINQNKEAKVSIKPAVDTYIVERKDMMRRVSLFGQTVSDANIDIAPKYAGRITAVNVTLGQKVKAGDVLLVQDTGDLDLSIAQNNAATRQAEADAKESESTYNASYQKEQIDYERTKAKYENYQSLYDQGAISKESLDTVYQDMINSKAALDTLLNQTMSGNIPATVESKKAAMEKSKVGTQSLEKQRNDLILRAPRDGVIGYRNIEAGAFVTVGQKLLTLVDNSKIYIDCQLSEQDVAAVKTGAKVKVDIESLGNSYEGTIIYVSPATDSTTKSYTARIELDVNDELIKAGMFGRTQIEILQRPQTLFVPKESVIEKNGKISLFIIDSENKAQERLVKLGLRNDLQVEILEGLQEGDRVAVTNLARLKNDMVVDINGSSGQVDNP